MAEHDIAIVMLKVLIQPQARTGAVSATGADEKLQPDSSI